MGCGASAPVILPVLNEKKSFPRLSERTAATISDSYEVVVIGSGYGGGIAASRSARAGKSVCILERGKEWIPGDFPEDLVSAAKEVKLKREGHKSSGNNLGLYELVVSEDLVVYQGNGLGGTSLINANVVLEADERVFQNEAFPHEFREDFDNFRNIDIKRALETLQPDVYPKTPAKMRQLQKVATEFHTSSEIPDMEDLYKDVQAKSFDSIFYKTPLCVTMHDKHKISNSFGVPQPPCNGCGNCMSGCNTGAKNTVNTNFLADAKYHGAEIFTQVKVIKVKQIPDDSRWQVFYQSFHDKDNINESQVVTADIVILGAGALGSTEILQRSKEDGLNISDETGKGFSGNGDQFSFSWANDEKSNVAGIASDYDPAEVSDPPGPCITSILDFRRLPNTPFHKQFLTEDAIIAKPFVTGLKALMAMSLNQLSHDSDPTDDLEQISDTITGAALDSSMPLLHMSHDEFNENGETAMGEIFLDEDGVKVQWKDSGKRPNYDRIDQIDRIAASILGGKYVENPLWSNRLEPFLSGRNTVTVHPLGGCNMGEDGMDGVVNHKGQVFDGNTCNVLEGLYVLDGSILPHSVGVNPSLTIAGVAERGMRLMAEDYRWDINYGFVTNPENIEFEDNNNLKPGVRVIEILEGEFTPTNKKTSDIKLTITLTSLDVVYLVDKDPNHEMLVDGTIDCVPISNKPITAKGTVQLFVPDTGPNSVIDQYLMIYRLKLYPIDKKKTYFFYGCKYMKKDSAFEIGLEDTTTVYITIYEGEDDTGKKIGEGIAVLNIPNMARALKGIQFTNIQRGFKERVEMKKKFIQLFLGEVWEIYSPFSSHQGWDTKANPRIKRPLRIPDTAQPKRYKALASDDVVVNLTRYNGGTKGPVVLFHAVAMTSSMFSLDTVSTNMVEYLVKRKYDVWLVDWRASFKEAPALKPYCVEDQANDVPAAVDKVLQVTGHKDVQIVGHCYGSLIVNASLLRGDLQGKVRSVVSSQMSFVPIASPYNKFKSAIYHPLSGFVESSDLVGFDTYDEDKDWIDHLYDKFAKGIGGIALSEENECRSSVCQKISFMYGLAFEHANMNNDTHRILHELFGKINRKCVTHTLRFFKAEVLQGFNGEDYYLPGYSKDKEERLASRDYMRHISRLNLPHFIFIGENNQIFQPEGSKNMHGLLTEAFPENADQFEFKIYPDYGHLDCIIGKNASVDIFPDLVAFLDKYAHTDSNADAVLYKQLEGGFQALKTNGKGSNVIEPNHCGHCIDHPDFTAKESNVEAPKANDTEELTVDQKIASIDLNMALPYEKPVVWKRKFTSPETNKYVPPPPCCIEERRVVQVTMTDTNKRDIYAVSDTHFGAYFGTKSPDRFQIFLDRLMDAAFQVHSLIMLGDMVEMWFIPINECPPTGLELAERLKSGEVPGVAKVLETIQKLAEDHDVKVYYIRGNHDHQMTEEGCKKMFGNKVEFVKGVLLYEIQEGDEVYRCRFEHGHEWDIFNSYCLGEDPDQILPGEQNLGHFVSRFIATSKFTGSCISKFLFNRLSEILTRVGFDFLGTPVVKMFSTDRMQRFLTSTLLEKGYQNEIHPEQKVVVNKDGDYVTFEQLCKYKLVERTAAKYGADRAFDMMKHSVNDFSDFLTTCDADVVVMGHSEVQACTMMPGRHGDLIYANGGAWHDEAGASGYIKITPPRHDIRKGNGIVELNWLPHDRDTFHTK